MALTALNLAAFPVIAGLLVGTGAVATSIHGTNSGTALASASETVSAPAPAEVKADVPCTAQTWPYIHNKCIVGQSAEAKRPVRFVMAPRAGEDTDLSQPAKTEPVLTTSNTVLRSPQATEPTATPVNAPRTRPEIRREKRTQKAERRVAVQSYQVPAEYAQRETRPVIVVRPLKLDQFR